MIEVHGVSKIYGNIVALHDLTFNVEKKEIVGFLGVNGSGKTTTLDILAGCRGPSRGRATICGFDLVNAPIEARRALGYLPDVPPLNNALTTSAAIAYSAALHGIPSRDIGKRTDSTLSRLGLRDVKNRIVQNLSKGYRQRVALAQAIVHDPQVLILDEPTEGLDPVQIIEIRELIRELGAERSVLLSSHLLTEVEQICQRVIIIDRGRIVHTGACRTGELEAVFIAATRAKELP